MTSLSTQPPQIWSEETSVTDMALNETTLASTHDITQLVSFETLNLIFLIGVRSIQLVISAFGVLSNIINIIVYLKMGFSETSSVTLFSLSVADLMTELWLLMMAAGYETGHTGADVPALAVTLVHTLSPVSNAVLGFSSYITALISFERCLCIVLPMKVKSIFTVKRVFIVLMVILTIQLSSLVPHYSTMQLVYFTSPISNRTGLVFRWTEHSLRVETITLIASFTLPSFICFIITVVCTTFLAIKLNQSLRWRQATAAAGTKETNTDLAAEENDDTNLKKQDQKSATVSTKETKVVRTVVFICAIYIVCFAPNVFTVSAMAVYPRFHQSDPYLGNLSAVFWSIVYPCQSVSSAVNIFVYFRMSTKYRDTFYNVFCRRGANKA